MVENDEMLEAAVKEADRHGAFLAVHARSAESVVIAARGDPTVDFTLLQNPAQRPAVINGGEFVYVDQEFFA